MKAFLIILLVFISACDFPPQRLRKPITVIQVTEIPTCKIVLKGSDGETFSFTYEGNCAHKTGDIYSE